MHSFTLQLTNGIYLPQYRLDRDSKDDLLKYLGEYLLEFVAISDVREKIKKDF